jgi:DNA-binding IscR family transcriptional regulator
MKLTLTRRGDYAVRAAFCLAKAWGAGGYVKIREVAEAMDLPVSYTPQVLKLLGGAGPPRRRPARAAAIG